MGALRVSKRSLRRFQRRFKEVLRVFKKSVNCVSQKNFQGCLKQVQRVFEEEFLRCVKDVLSFKGSSRKIKGCS